METGIMANTNWTTANQTLANGQMPTRTACQSDNWQPDNCKLEQLSSVNYDKGQLQQLPNGQ